MLLVLGAFAVLPLLLPWLVARIGPLAFYVAAVLPIAGFVQAAFQTPRILAGDVPFESYAWIPPLGIDLSMRMDTLSWLMTLIVTGVGALGHGSQNQARWGDGGQVLGGVHGDIGAAVEHGLLHRLGEHPLPSHRPDGVIGAEIALGRHAHQLVGDVGGDRRQQRADVAGLPTSEGAHAGSRTNLRDAGDVHVVKGLGASG